MHQSAELVGEFGYTYDGDTESCDHAYTVPAVLEELKKTGKPKHVFDLGCGNGAVGNRLSLAGYEVTGIDLSSTGIANANARYPHLRLEQGSVYDDLASRYGQFPHVISLEVVEHLFYPRTFAKTAYDLLEPGGHLLVTTPYHGYLKNLAIALAGRFDQHVKPLWDYGHIKFFSEATLTALLNEAGFADVVYRRLGRIAPLAKSMLAVARKLP